MKRRFTEDSWRREPWMMALVDALITRKSEMQMANFLRDVASLSELQALSERLEIAKLLGKGMSYRQISAVTKASTTTITRVAHFLENGEGGYRDVLRVHRHHELRRKKRKNDGMYEIDGVSVQPVIKARKQDTPSISPLQKFLGRKH